MYEQMFVSGSDGKIPPPGLEPGSQRLKVADSKPLSYGGPTGKIKRLLPLQERLAVPTHRVYLRRTPDLDHPDREPRNYLR